MRNAELWQPSKFVEHHGKWHASRDPEELNPGSWLVAELVARRYSELLPRFARGRLLDLGCGKVPFYGAYRTLVNECVCVDWGNTLHPSPFLDLECDLNDALSFPSDHFDSVIFSDVLEHLRDPVSVCGEIARIMAPGGHLLMNVPFLYWIHEEPFDYYRFTEYSLRRFMLESHLEVVSLEPVGGALEVLGDLSAKLMSRMPGFGSTLAMSLQRAVAGFANTAAGKRLRSKSGKKMPLGYFLVARKAGTIPS